MSRRGRIALWWGLVAVGLPGLVALSVVLAFVGPRSMLVVNLVSGGLLFALDVVVLARAGRSLLHEGSTAVGEEC